MAFEDRMILGFADPVTGEFTPWKPGPSGAAPVSKPSDYIGMATPFETDDQDTTPTEVTGLSARVIHIGFGDNDTDGTPTVPASKFLYVSFNYAATSELDVVATRRAIPFGESRVFVFPEGAECTQFAYKADAAPGSGASTKVYGEYVE